MSFISLGKSLLAISNKPQTIDDYLAKVDDDQRVALEKLRKTIHSAAPQAEECISYQIASFRLAGRMLVGMGATKKHCALYLMSNSIVSQYAGELAAFDTSAGTIRFSPDNPIPAPLVKKLVKSRIAENSSLDERKK